VGNVPSDAKIRRLFAEACVAAEGDRETGLSLLLLRLDQRRPEDAGVRIELYAIGRKRFVEGTAPGWLKLGHRPDPADPDLWRAGVYPHEHGRN
jgi:hypothetical protein